MSKPGTLEQREERWRILSLGDHALGEAVGALLGSVRMRVAEIAEETEGIGVDLVLLGGPRPLQDLAALRVHPRLYDVPVVIVLPHLPEDADQWRASRVWPVARGPDLPTRVAGVVGEVLRMGSAASNPATSSLVRTTLSGLSEIESIPAPTRNSANSG